MGQLARVRWLAAERCGRCPGVGPPRGDFKTKAQGREAAKFINTDRHMQCGLRAHRDADRSPEPPVRSMPARRPSGHGGCPLQACERRHRCHPGLGPALRGARPGHFGRRPGRQALAAAAAAAAAAAGGPCVAHRVHKFRQCACRGTAGDTAGTPACHAPSPPARPAATAAPPPGALCGAALRQGRRADVRRHQVGVAVLARRDAVARVRRSHTGAPAVEHPRRAERSWPAPTSACTRMPLVGPAAGHAHAGAQRPSVQHAQRVSPALRHRWCQLRFRASAWTTSRG